MTLQAILDNLRARLASRPGDEVGTMELVASFGMDRHDAANRLRALKRAGLVEICGRLGKALVFRLTEKGRA